MFLSHFEINLFCVNFNYLCECGNYIKTLSIFYDAWGSSWGLGEMHVKKWGFTGGDIGQEISL